MRFLADMGVSARVVEWLRAEGHDAVHLRDLGLQRLPNGDIFALAANQDRVVLTFDLDFGEILAHSKGTTVAVVLFRLHNPRTPFVIQRLQTVLEKSGPALARGAIAVVEDSRHRLRERWPKSP